jgi:hypothetical protein
MATTEVKTVDERKAKSESGWWKRLEGWWKRLAERFFLGVPA